MSSTTKVYTLQDLSGKVAEADINQLSNALETYGFKYQQGQFGGEFDEPIQIIARINIDTNSVFWILALNIISNAIWDAAKAINRWLNKHKELNRNARPVLIVYIYSRHNFSSLRISLGEAASKRRIIFDLIRAKKSRKHQK